MSEEHYSIRMTEKSSKENYRTTPMLIEEENNYDPHLHRVVENPTSNIETLVHILKGALGTGILAMPEAFFNSGYVFGLFGTLVIGFLATYCLHVLIKSQYILCKRHKIPILSYPSSMKMALEEGPSILRFLAPSSIFIVDGFLIVYQLGICCVYIVFVATNVKQLFDVYIVDLDVKIHMCILFIPLLLISSIRSLKLLAPFSTLANVITFIGIAFIMNYIFSDLPSIGARVPFASINTFPLFFGTVLFALEAVGVVISLENNMENPKSFGGCFGVLNIGMAIVTVLYAGTGFLGYLKYGQEVEGSITLNLPQTEILAQLIKAIFAVAVFISYALQGYVPVEIVWKNYMKKIYGESPNALIIEYVIRATVVVVTTLLAIAIPLLGLFISLFGALCLSVLGIIFPAVMEICVLWPDKLGKFNYIVIKDILLILFGMAGLCAGTYVSLRDIIANLS